MAGRDLSLTPRKVATRAKAKVEIFKIDDIERHFNENISYIKSQYQTADALIKDGKTGEAADIWRSQIVFLDSAFDFYLHELVQFGILRIFHGEWLSKTEKYNNLVFSMKNIEEALANTDDDTWLKNWVNGKFASDSLMSYSAFKDVCNLLGLDYNKIADDSFYERGNTEKTVDKLKRRIDELFYRRNRIAHQMDRLRENAERQDITRDVVEQFINDVEKIVHAVGNEVQIQNQT